MTPKFAICLFVVISTVIGDDSDIGLNTIEMITNHGYPVESHNITTEDGYILTYHRIPYGKNGNAGTKPPVLLMHGLISSSADYVNMGPNTSLAYLLADIGYDVWLGNARGNAWSRNHISLDPIKNPSDFFNFSWHEIGYYDLPAAIDYILAQNGDSSLQYIGHSQGCTSFMVMATTKPEYNKKVKLASLMGPASFMEHQTGTLLTTLANYIYEIEEILFKKYKIVELPFPDVLRQLASAYCVNPENYKTCQEAIGLVDGVDAAELDPINLLVVLSNAPSNAGTKQFIHYGQLIKNGGFSYYDFGNETNLKLYGSEKPPSYDLSKISAPVALYYGKNDGLVNYQDAQTVASKLPNLVKDYLIPYDLFNHIDFIFATNVVNLLYVELIKTMQNFEGK